MPFEDFQFEKDGSVFPNAEAALRNVSVIAKENQNLEDQITDIFESQSGAIFCFLAAVFGSEKREELEDAMQEAFLKLYQNLHRGERIENVRAWLFRVAHNTAIDRLRAQKFIAPVSEVQWEEIRERMPDPTLNPEQLAIKLEELAQLHDAVKRLSLQERQCLHLRVEGFRYREIGEILGIATPTVGEFLRRAFKKLMREFTE